MMMVMFVMMIMISLNVVSAHTTSQLRGCFDVWAAERGDCLSICRSTLITMISVMMFSIAGWPHPTALCLQEWARECGGHLAGERSSSFSKNQGETTSFTCGLLT